jgi:hypothetical protein
VSKPESTYPMPISRPVYIQISILPPLARISIRAGLSSRHRRIPSLAGEHALIGQRVFRPRRIGPLGSAPSILWTMLSTQQDDAVVSASPPPTVSIARRPSSFPLSARGYSRAHARTGANEWWIGGWMGGRRPVTWMRVVLGTA